MLVKHCLSYKVVIFLKTLSYEVTRAGVTCIFKVVTHTESVEPFATRIKMKSRDQCANVH